MTNADTAFTGSLPRIYDTFLVPMIFEPYGADIARRLSALPVRRVLEVAAGTGVVTRAVTAVLPAGATLVATDLNQAMLDQAAARGTARPVEWRQADALQLPFDDATFDAVVCQFGVMFFPDKPRAFAEARRVLTGGGLFLFNVWDRLDENEIPHVVTTALESVFPENPTRFMARVPHGYYDPDVIRRDLVAGGFTSPPQIETVAARSRAASAKDAAVAFCQGTPMRSEIEARDPEGLDKATTVAAQAIAARFGPGAVDARIQAHVVTVHRE
jgi:SAM-dependent methyltransferase